MTEQELKEIKLAWANDETVQYYVGGVWATWESKSHLSLQVSSRWRVEPKTININGHEVPEPLRELKRGQQYYVTDLSHKDLSPQIFWSDHGLERLWLERGLCHSTKEASIAHEIGRASCRERETTAKVGVEATERRE